MRRSSCIKTKKYHEAYLINMNEWVCFRNKHIGKSILSKMSRIYDRKWNVKPKLERSKTKKEMKNQKMKICNFQNVWPKFSTEQIFGNFILCKISSAIRKSNSQNSLMAIPRENWGFIKSTPIAIVFYFHNLRMITIRTMHGPCGSWRRNEWWMKFQNQVFGRQALYF